VSLDGSNAVRIDESHGEAAVHFVTKWFCDPPAPGTAWHATSQSWIRGLDHESNFLSLVMVYAWEPL
jgi:hypothetical protein